MVRVAAIDCGTNSIRLLIADVVRRASGGTSLGDIHREMRIVRLGQGVDATGMLADDALARTRDALRDYATAAAREGVESTRMVATSATRDARNRETFFTMTREVLGVPAEVITGDEEARLSFAGAVAGIDTTTGRASAEPAHGPFLVVDVGGGSTELVLGDWDGARVNVRAARSVDIGCVRLTERCLSADPPTRAQVEVAEQLTRQTLRAAFAEVPVWQAATWVGVSGTVTTLSAVAQGLPCYDPERIHRSTMSQESIELTTGKLLGASHAERAAIGCIHPGRVDVIGAGAIVVRVLAEELALRAGIMDMLVSEHDILDGIALSLAGDGHTSPTK